MSSSRQRAGVPGSCVARARRWGAWRKHWGSTGGKGSAQDGGNASRSRARVGAPRAAKRRATDSGVPGNLHMPTAGLVHETCRVWDQHHAGVSVCEPPAVEQCGWMCTELDATGC